MNDDINTELQFQVIRLSSAVGLAIGALEIIKISPHDFNKDGLAKVLNELKKAQSEVTGEAADE